MALQSIRRPLKPTGKAAYEYPAGYTGQSNDTTDDDTISENSSINSYSSTATTLVGANFITGNWFEFDPVTRNGGNWSPTFRPGQQTPLEYITSFQGLDCCKYHRIMDDYLGERYKSFRKIRLLNARLKLEIYYQSVTQFNRYGLRRYRERAIDCLEECRRNIRECVAAMWEEYCCALECANYWVDAPAHEWDLNADRCWRKCDGAREKRRRKMDNIEEEFGHICDVWEDCPFERIG